MSSENVKKLGNRNRDGDPPLSLVNLKVMGRSKRKELSIMVKQ